MNNIKKYRIEKDYRLSELAELASISVGYLCHLGRGTRINPSYNVMENISNILGQNLSDIF